MAVGVIVIVIVAVAVAVNDASPAQARRKLWIGGRGRPR
jgi:hypothetical protein